MNHYVLKTTPSALYRRIHNTIKKSHIILTIKIIIPLNISTRLNVEIKSTSVFNLSDNDSKYLESIPLLTDFVCRMFPKNIFSIYQ